jgi:hypothetical protein
MQALVHSGTLAAALAFGVGVAADAETPAVPLSAIAIILILDIFLFRVLRTTLLRSDPPKPISPDPHDAIPRISKLISEDWQNIARNYVEMN